LQLATQRLRIVSQKIFIPLLSFSGSGKILIFSAVENLAIQCKCRWQRFGVIFIVEFHVTFLFMAWSRKDLIFLRSSILFLAALRHSTSDLKNRMQPYDQ